MQKAVLIYNPRAGGLERIGLQETMSYLKQSDIDSLYQVTESESDLDNILDSSPGLVIAAGGDGTIRGIAKRIIGTDTRLGIIPMGTANNFARSLGIEGHPRVIAKNIADYRPEGVDVGKVYAPWGENIFLEGVGFGFFADLLDKYRPVTEKKIGRALSVFFESISEVNTYKSEIKIDGENITGDYLLVEILNSESIGPRLAFAKDSHINDGHLNVVRITKSENVASVALSLFTDNLENLEGVRRSKAREVSFLWNGFPVHIDDEIFPDVNEKINYWYATNVEHNTEDKKKKNREIKVEVLDKELEVLLPNHE